MKLPTPDKIKIARTDAGLTQTQAADMIYSKLRSWQHWEDGDRKMHPGLFELFTIKIAINNGRKIMKKQIKDLELWEIDYLVSKAENLLNENLNDILVDGERYSPTTNPSQSWPIIERDRIAVLPSANLDEWVSRQSHRFIFSHGKTSLEAAMRCYVASKFGDEVEL
jgi:DNA (cytosine-5)-methyltransferase 1